MIYRRLQTHWPMTRRYGVFFLPPGVVIYSVVTFHSHKVPLADVATGRAKEGRYITGCREVSTGELLFPRACDQGQDGRCAVYLRQAEPGLGLSPGYA